MKNFLWVLIILLCVNTVYARNYAKLQEKEMKHSQKYGTTKIYLDNYKDINKTNKKRYKNATGVKAPKAMIIGDYKHISSEKFKEKVLIDNEKYEKIAKKFGIRNLDNYNAQAKGEDYYKLYRIAEKIIRANKLDYLNWRIAIYRDSKSPNAFNTNLNYIAISTSLYDSFSDNEDALAFIIGHEMGHSLLGHQQRLSNIRRKMRFSEPGSIVYNIIERKYLIDSKNAEYAADAEGIKLAAKAGYDLNNSIEILSFFKTYSNYWDFYSNHPNIEKRIDNYNTVRSLIPMKEWQEWGRYNIYKSNVLKVNASSDRASFVIVGTPAKSKDYYHPETFEEYYLRCGYARYLDGDFEKAAEYFDKYFGINSSNSLAFVYASYAYDELYKNKNDIKYKNKSIEYAQKAINIDPKNKYATNILKKEEND